MIIYMVITGVFALLGSLISNRLKSKMTFYSKLPISSGLSGAEVAKKMLNDNNISDVQIVEGKGFLTDHYNPTTKTVSLSPAIYNTNSVAAAAVAAHECGHAVQHATGYNWLQMRSKLVPVVQIGSKFYSYILMAGLGLMAMDQVLGWSVAAAGVALFAFTTLFSLITLPVEYDASNRALAWLSTANITRGEETRGAKDALKWAARTYLVGAIASIAQLAYWIMRLMASSRR